MRVDPEWIEAIDRARAKLTEQTGVKVSRSAFVELAVRRHIEAAGLQ